MISKPLSIGLTLLLITECLAPLRENRTCIKDRILGKAQVGLEEMNPEGVDTEYVRLLFHQDGEVCLFKFIHLPGDTGEIQWPSSGKGKLCET